MLVGREKPGVFATEIERLFQERQHGREVIGRPRSRPGIIGGGADRVGARDMLGGNLDRFFEVASRDADQACSVRVRGEIVGT